MAKDTPSILLDRFSGSKPQLIGGKQRICTIDGYAMPLACRGDLMYLSLLGKPSDEDLERYPAVYLTGLHEWDPSVLDFTHPSGDGEPPWSNDPNERFAFDPNLYEFWDCTHRNIRTLSNLDDSSKPLTRANQHVIRSNQHVVNNDTPDYENLMLYFGWVNVDTVQKTMEQSTQLGVSTPNTFPMRKHLKSRNPAFNIPEDMSQLLLILFFLTPLLLIVVLKNPHSFYGCHFRPKAWLTHHPGAL